MQAKNWGERILMSYGFSVALFLVWGTLTSLRAKSLLDRFTWVDFLWVAYNGTISILFLVRSGPSVVSLNPVHWIVALLTSFSGLFFLRDGAGPPPAELIGDTLILVGLGGGGIAALALRRSYDFLPALRGVTTDWVYKVVRHPMYLSSIVIRLGYVVRHPSLYNLVVFAVIVLLYDRRAVFEERIMRHSPTYREYELRVKHRFVPGVY